MSEALSSRPGWGEVNSHVDFQAEIKAAMKAAKRFNEEADNARHYASGAESVRYDDLAVIALPKRSRAKNKIDTTSPEDYKALLLQAYRAVGMANGFTETGLDKDAVAETAAEDWEHELAHGRAAYDYASEGTVVYYGVEFFTVIVDGIRRYGWRPTMCFSGAIRKIHYAYLALAPDDPSPADEAFVMGLGYDPSAKQRIREVAERTPRAPEMRQSSRGLQSPLGALVDLILRRFIKVKNTTTAV